MHACKAHKHTHTRVFQLLIDFDTRHHQCSFMDCYRASDQLGKSNSCKLRCTSWIFFSTNHWQGTNDFCQVQCNIIHRTEKKEISENKLFDFLASYAASRSCLSFSTAASVSSSDPNSSKSSSSSSFAADAGAAFALTFCLLPGKLKYKN